MDGQREGVTGLAWPALTGASDWWACGAHWAVGGTPQRPLSCCDEARDALTLTQSDQFSVVLVQ